MIRLDTNKEKKLEFSLSLVGRFSGDIESHFRIYFENYQIGFPAQINNYEKVVVKLPKLSKFIQNFPEKARASLEIVQDRDMYLAWQDEVQFKQTDIKASLNHGQEEDKEKLEIKASLKTTNEEKIKEKIEENNNITCDMSSALIEQLKQLPKSFDIKMSKESADKKKQEIKNNNIAYKITEAFKSIKQNGFIK